MKTLLMVPDIFRGEGGIARIMRLYLRALCEQAGPNDQVGYVARYDRPGDEDKIEPDTKRSLWLRSSCGDSKFRYIMVVFIHGWAADRVICGHLHHLPVVWLLSLFRPRLRYYLVAHGIEVWRPYSLLEKLALGRAYRVFCVSEYTRRQLLRFANGLDSAKLVIVPNTFDPRFETMCAHTQEKNFGSFPRILVVSRLVASDPYKGVDLVVETMPAILREFPSAQLRVVGGGDDLPRLKALAISLGLIRGPGQLPDGCGQLSGASRASNNLRPSTDNCDGFAVAFTNIVDDNSLRAEYAACDIFALPSRKEGFGLVYLEAMSYGKPCIAARAGGAPEVVTDEVGAIVEYGSTTQIALAVADLIYHPRDPAAMRRRAEEFAFPAFQKRLEAALQAPVIASG